MTNTYRSILVPLDGSAFAEQALPLALELARRNNAILQVALVHHPVPALVPAVEMPDASFEVDQDTRHKETTYLSEVVQRLTALHQPVSSVVLEGPVADALETQIIVTDADLVVTTTHGRGHLARFWLGSVADQLMRRLRVPILLVRPEEPAKQQWTGSITKVLVALDGSPFAEHIMAQALHIARAFAARIELLYVLEPPAAIADPSVLMVLPPSPETERAARERATDYLKKIAADLVAPGLGVDCRVIDGSPVAATILDEARATGASLIALASHGLGGVQRMVLGSVADKVIRGSTIPVLVVRPTVH